MSYLKNKINTKVNYIEDWACFELEEVGSTNDEAKAMSKDDIDKLVVTAKRQLSGRGRRGHEWVSMEGNLFASFALKIDPRHIGVLSFIFSLSIFDMLKRFDSELDIKLKWPNDVLVYNRKISGILIEKGEGEYFIVGIGINIVNYPKNVNLKYDATCLKNINIQKDRNEILREYINILNRNLEQWKNFGFEKIKDNWLKNAKNLGQEIVVKFDNNEIKGIFIGVDENGYLLLEKNGQVEKIYAGDVFYI